MSWNGSEDSQTNAATNLPKNGRRRGVVTDKFGAPFKRGALAGLIVVALGSLALYCFTRSEPSVTPQTEKPKAKGLIAEVTPAVVSKVVPTNVASSARRRKTSAVPSHPATNRWGNPWHWGPTMKLRPANTTRIDRASLPISYTAFTHLADRDIAGLLTIEPGTSMIGAVEYDKNFVESFRESLVTPALIKGDDSDEVKELKRAVIETKAELKARMEAGEDIAKIMNDTRRELYELGAYRDEIRQQVEVFRQKGGITADDMKDMVDAANKMLEERGLKKLALPSFYIRQIELRSQRHPSEKEK